MGLFLPVNEGIGKSPWRAPVVFVEGRNSVSYGSDRLLVSKSYTAFAVIRETWRNLDLCPVSSAGKYSVGKP